MIKKLNLKLTASLVSFFIGTLLLVVSHGNKYCLCFGLCAYAIALVFFALFSFKNIEKSVELLNKQMQEYNIKLEALQNDNSAEAIAMIEELSVDYAIMYKKQKQQKFVKIRIFIFFIIFAVFLVLVGFSLLFS